MLEALILESNDFFPKCDTFPLGRKQPQKVQEKKKHNTKMLA